MPTGVYSVPQEPIFKSRGSQVYTTPRQRCRSPPWRLSRGSNLASIGGWSAAEDMVRTGSKGKYSAQSGRAFGLGTKTRYRHGKYESPCLDQAAKRWDGANLSTKKTGRILAFDFECVT